MPDASVLRIEKLLASAHRSLWAAAQAAEDSNRQGVADDLMQIAEELRRVHESVVTRSRRRTAS